ncbi:MAG TPA: hypothetical protein VFM46_00455, partial [Pseudomonadales bacterium]|nr:hypothetical protein [Pseudomonadales bacterium]
FNNLQTAQGGTTVLNVTASAVIKATAGYVARIAVVSAPSTSVTVYDAATLAAASTVNRVVVIAGTAGQVNQEVEFATSSGIVVDPGTNGVVTVKYQ